ncbi:MAG TPA: S9 family peptidase [Roseateles sp.]
MTVASAVQGFHPEDFFSLRLPGDPQISPDGRWVAHTLIQPRVEEDVWGEQVRVIERASRQAQSLGKGGQPRWAPDSRRLAFTRGTADGCEVVLWDSATQQATVLATLPEAAEGLAWSPDGGTLAFVMLVREAAPTGRVGGPPAWHALRTSRWAKPARYTERLVRRVEGVDADELPHGHHQIFLMDTTSGRHRQLTVDPFDHGSPVSGITKLNLAGRISWTPDSRYVVMSMRREAMPDGPWDPEAMLATEVHEFCVADGSVRTLSRFKGVICRAVVSPDGQWIAFVGFKNRRRAFHTCIVHVMPRAGGEARALPHPQGLEIHQELQWLPDSSGLLALYPYQGEGCLARVDLQGEWSQIRGGVGGSLSTGYVMWMKGFTVSRDGDIAMLDAHEGRSDEIAVLDAHRHHTDVLSSHGSWLSERSLARPQAFWAPTPTSMQGWLLRPPDAPADKTLPLLVWLHGGPYLSWGPQFAAVPQIWASAGYAVLMLNPRGSLGYGEAYSDALHHDLPGQDDLQIVDAVDHVVSLGGIDPARVFLAGESAGGLMTAWLIGHSDRFAAAAVIYGVMDWTSAVLTQDRPDYYPFYWRPAPPWAPGMQEDYWKRSPLSVVDRVKTPTIVMCGERDWRTPMSQSEQYYAALKLCGVDAALASFEGNNHGLELHPSQWMDLVDLVDHWFQRHDPTRS